jgi:GNAT superfamily N-acetyltransferase
VNPQIRLAETREDVARCHPVMRELRPHLDLRQFVDQVARQQAGGYRLAFAESADAVEACAGFRVLENLAWGRFLYVDDLVTAAGARSRGFGARLFEWLIAMARAEGCAQLHLDSGVQRFAAHRFYLRERMEITSHHFALKL